MTIHHAAAILQRSAWNCAASVPQIASRKKARDRLLLRLKAKPRRTLILGQGARV
jgi:hypothetical protein